MNLSRSWLFVPGDSPRKMERCWSSGADAVVFDLEDAVAPAQKIASRALIAAAIAAHPDQRTALKVYVRINAADTGLAAEDVRTTLPSRPDGYVLPKVDDPAEVAQVATLLSALEGAHGIAAEAPGPLPLLT